MLRDRVPGPERIAVVAFDSAPATNPVGEMPIEAPQHASAPVMDFLGAFLEEDGAAAEGAALPEAELQEPAIAEVGPVITGQAVDDRGLNDDPGSEAYRYRDEGYVPGSRKELAVQQIRIAAREGRQVRSSSIDWAGLEENPRIARSLITKSNLFGSVDWPSLRSNGMEAGAGFLIDRVYAAVGKEPSEDSAQARKDYAFGLDTLRDRLEACRTPQAVADALDQLREESEGYVLSPNEQDQYDTLKAQYHAVLAKIQAFTAEERRLERPLEMVRGEIRQIEWDQGKRESRGWKRDPELDDRMEELKPRLVAAEQALQEWRDRHPEAVERWKDLGRYSATLEGVWSNEHRRLSTEMAQIRTEAALRNLVENPLCRGWALMGERFIGVLCYRSSRGSEAFRGHMATAKAGRIQDWSWSEKEVARVATSSKESTRFQLQVADRYERIEGRVLSLESSEQLKLSFGLKAVEYGLWVAEDFNSAKFHTERAGAAFADLADLLDVEDRSISLGGELAMGFGSRGQGAIGWRTSAPAATYYPERRIINLTKNAGGGTLGHEWSHAFDNILPELATGRPSRAEDNASENPELLPTGPLREAMQGLMKAITEGPHRHDETVVYTGRDVLVARQNIDRSFATRASIGQAIKDAGNVTAAVLAVRERFSSIRDRDGNLTRAAKNRIREWTTVAAAYYGGNPDGGTILVRSGVPQSRFAYEAVNLDRGSRTPYWATRHELFARAFQSWIEDRLAAQGRRNDYLSWHADNSWYVDPIFGPRFPYPEGEERTRINAAFDKLAAAIRTSGVLEPKEVPHAS